MYCYGLPYRVALIGQTTSLVSTSMLWSNDFGFWIADFGLKEATRAKDLRILDWR